MNPDLKELVSPEQAEHFILFGALLLTIVAAAWGGYTIRWRGAVAGLTGPLLWGAWRFNSWITRYDPKSGYFGLDKVWVLLVEAVLFIVIGLVLGIIWGRLLRSHSAQN